MKERSIIFSGPMVRAIIDGRKTQTRRIIKPQPDYFGKEDGEDSWHWNGWRWQDKPGLRLKGPDEDCPYGQPGDRLWVREKWRIDGAMDCVRTSFLKNSPVGYFNTKISHGGRWRPSIHMPRWASRITLEIQSVRVERLQDITPGDCRSEGMPADNNDIGVRYGFGQLWQSIHGPGSWDENPWVWVVEFKRIKP